MELFASGFLGPLFSKPFRFLYCPSNLIEKILSIVTDAVKDGLANRTSEKEVAEAPEVEATVETPVTETEASSEE